jgi:hypothetical protein
MFTCASLAKPPAFSASAQQVVPLGPVHVAERQAEPADHVGVQALGVQHLGDVVDRRRVRRGDHGFLVHVAHQAYLALEVRVDRAVRAGYDRVRLDADAAQRGHRMLGRLGFQLTRGADVGQQADVQEEAPVATDLVPDLADRLQERLGLDVPDGPAHLGDHHVDLVAAHLQDAGLDLVGDVRDDLHGVAEVSAAALVRDHRRVDLAGGDVRLTRQVGVEEALVVPDVQVGLGAVVGHEHLAVLEGVHGARVDVEVRVELLHHDPQAAQFQQAAEAGGGQSFAEAGGNAPSDKEMSGLCWPRMGWPRMGRPWIK